jgi:ubiquinone/menaquinone biosynthesis C-methylase UbiE
MKSIRRNSALKIALWLFGGLVVLILLNVIGQGLSTLDRLTFVERERDTWQRAPAIIEQLNLHDGSRVVDLGCGAGYFALKLSAAVGASGKVQAVDILRLPLTFLWIRAYRAGIQNIEIIHGEPDDPHISAPVDAVLIANTYHELARPGVILAHVRDVLVDGGRLVIVDRGPESTNAGHAVDPALVEAELRRDGFDIQARQDHFLDQPDEGPWFLIAAVPIMRHKS